jgi:hypothetical protein
MLMLAVVKMIMSMWVVLAAPPMSEGKITKQGYEL